MIIIWEEDFRVINPLKNKMADLKIGSTNVTKLLREKYKMLDKKGYVTLLQVSAANNLVVNTEALKILTNENKSECIYITLGKSFTELDKFYKSKGVDVSKLYYIDAISQMYGNKKTSTKRVKYTSGPIDIDSITVELREMLPNLKTKNKYVFLDSVTTFLLYNSLHRTLRFSQFLTDTLKALGVNGVMVSIVRGKATEKLVSELSKLCDESIVIDKKEALKESK
jgi:KaiC/GvpD/RAD55 family RecA-like ATPase